jgi:hypothetical protein
MSTILAVGVSQEVRRASREAVESPCRLAWWLTAGTEGVEAGR